MPTDYPTKWIAIDAAAKLLGVRPGQANAISRAEKWRRLKDTTGRYVYALADIRTTERNRRNSTR